MEPDTHKTGDADAEKAGSAGDLSRRRVILGGGIGLGLLGIGAVIGHETPRLRHTASSSSAATSPTKASAKTSTKMPTEPTPSTQSSTTSYVSTKLTAPTIDTWKTGTTGEGLLFLGPLQHKEVYSEQAQEAWDALALQGACDRNEQRRISLKGYQGVIVDDTGEPVWIAPPSASTTSPLSMTTLDVQEYRGEPALVYWSGTEVAGHGVGECTIMDTGYRKVATVRAVGNTRADLHEFKLTDRGTALIIVYPTRRADLRAVGGPKRGYIYDCRAQEIDIATGKAVLDWSALDHLGVEETYFGITQHEDHDGTSKKRAFDPFHLNSIDDNGGRLLLSMRHTHAIYAIDRSAGTVLWRLGGKKSDFDIPEDAEFAWQHDARWNGDHEISLFDNDVYSGPGRSQGLVLALDEQAGSASLKKRLTYDRHRGTAMGSMQLLPGGNGLVGWGVDPAATEFDGHGRAVFEMTLPEHSYRVRRHVWRGEPTTKPAIAAGKDGTNVAVHLSWNGATEIAQWRVTSRSGDDDPVTTITPRTGFETTLLVAPAEQFSAEALDADGNVLGRTNTASI